MKEITIESVEQKKVQFGTLITLVDGKNRYTFFDRKKDGNKTKAYEQFTRYSFGVGDKVQAETKEEKVPLKDDPSKHFNRKTILYFKEVENTPVFEKAKIANIDNEIKAEDLPF